LSFRPATNIGHCTNKRGEIGRTLDEILTSLIILRRIIFIKFIHVPQNLYGIAEMSEEDYNILHERRRKQLEDKQQRLSKKNKGKKAR
jgi:hypothetical protein